MSRRNWSTSSSGLPTTMVSPAMATDAPKPSDAVASAATSFAWSDQTPFACTYTNAAPALAAPGRSEPGLPMTAV